MASPVLFPRKPTLVGERVLLRPFTPEVEAARLVVAHAFSATDLHRIELEVHAVNPRAKHVDERAGFRVEGRRRDAFVFDGERVDAVLMAVLRPEHRPGPGGREPGQADA